MPDSWRWDQSLFRGSATYYEQGRLAYAPGYTEQLAKILALDGSGRLLDVGCGPGTVVLPFAEHFHQAVGVDPDPDMLVAAERRARTLGVRNVRWAEARAEDLPGDLGRFQVILFAQSFHWTEREQVAATARDMLEPGGWLVLLSDLKTPRTEPAELPYPPPPYERITELTRQYLGTVRRAGQGLLINGTPSGEGAILTDAGFEDLRRLVVPSGAVVARATDDIVAWAFSRSDMAPHLFGDRLQEFERDLRTLLARTSPVGVFAEQLPDTEIRYAQRARQ